MEPRPPLIRIALFRNDLRLHDQPLLHAACRPGPRTFALLPLYCVDPRKYDLSPLNSFGGIGPFTCDLTWCLALPAAAQRQAQFLVETVEDLQSALRDRQSDLLVRFGEPAIILRGLVNHLKDALDADVEVFCQKEQIRETTPEEMAFSVICTLILTDGGSTMIHPEDDPFKPKSCPSNFNAFRRVVEGLCERMARHELPIIDQFPPFPEVAHSYLVAHDEGGLLACLVKKKGSHDKRNAIIHTGGETKGIEWLDHFLSSHPLQSIDEWPCCDGCDCCRIIPSLVTRNLFWDTVPGAHRVTLISRWLAFGALSARSILCRIWPAKENPATGFHQDSLDEVFEVLLWRDYYQFAGHVPLSEERLLKLFGILSSPVTARANDTVTKGKGKKPIDGSINQNTARKEWDHDARKNRAWLEGLMGIPLLDASKRELAATGFISKELYFDWRMGVQWSQSQLRDIHTPPTSTDVDTDPREWIWIVLEQVKEHDIRGYVRQWLPELAQHGGKAQQASYEYPTEPIVLAGEWTRLTGQAAGAKGGSKSGRGKGSSRGNGRK